MDIMELGNLIRQHRKEAELTQAQLAKEIETTKQYVGQIEKGERNITHETLTKICKALNCDLIIQFQKR